MEIGLVFALLAGASFAANSIFVRRAVFKATELFTAVLITGFIGTLLFSLVLFFTAEWDKVWSASWRGVALLAAAGIIHFVVGRFLNYTCIQLIGANRASALNRTNIFVAVTLGIILLNESLTTPLVLGVLGIAGGAALVSIEKQKGTSKIQVKGVLSGLGTGLCWGVSSVLIKAAVTEIGSPVVGTFISYVAAFLITASFLFSKRRREQLIQINRSSLIPLIVAGLFVSMAVLLRYTALSYSPVSLVSPLIGTNTLFVLVFSFLLNRHIEVFTWKVVVGMVLATAGAVFISL